MMNNFHETAEITQGADGLYICSWVISVIIIACIIIQRIYGFSFLLNFHKNDLYNGPVTNCILHRFSAYHFFQSAARALAKFSATPFYANCLPRLARSGKGRVCDMGGINSDFLQELSRPHPFRGLG